MMPAWLWCLLSRPAPNELISMRVVTEGLVAVRVEKYHMWHRRDTSELALFWKLNVQQQMRSRETFARNRQKLPKNAGDLVAFPLFTI